MAAPRNNPRASTVAGILRDARALIAEPRFWIQGGLSAVLKGSAETYEHVIHPRARCFCMQGAVCKALGMQHIPDHPGPRYNHAIGALKHAIDTFSADHEFFEVANFNDDPRTTHEEVLAVFDMAIARLEKR